MINVRTIACGLVVALSATASQPSAASTAWASGVGPATAAQLEVNQAEADAGPLREVSVVEVVALTSVGAALGVIVGYLVAGPIAAAVAGAMAGMNGFVSGVGGIYRLETWQGRASFVADSTWGLIGTSLGNMVHIANLFWPDADYNRELSVRQNRHNYSGGFRLSVGFATTHGNVISNAFQSGKGYDPEFIGEHEELHIWQNRMFGPLFQATYLVWGVGGTAVASVVWVGDTEEDFGSLVQTAAYFDNPFEYWAYQANDFWMPPGTNERLSW